MDNERGPLVKGIIVGALMTATLGALVAGGYVLIRARSGDRTAECERWKQGAMRAAEMQVLAGVDPTADLAVFLQPNADGSEIASLRVRLESLPQVRSVRFESKEEAFANFRKLFEDDPQMLETARAEGFPASFRVYLNDPSLKDEVTANLGGQRDVQAVKDEADRYAAFKTAKRDAIDDQFQEYTTAGEYPDDDGVVVRPSHCER